MENSDIKRLNFKVLIPQLTFKFKKMVANNEIEVTEIFDISDQAAKMLKNLIVDDVKNSGLSKLKKEKENKGFFSMF